jgi:hypothetical protein
MRHKVDLELDADCVLVTVMKETVGMQVHICLYTTSVLLILRFGVVGSGIE